MAGVPLALDEQIASQPYVDSVPDTFPAPYLWSPNFRRMKKGHSDDGQSAAHDADKHGDAGYETSLRLLNFKQIIARPFGAWNIIFML
jgi:hypothetical protein